MLAHFLGQRRVVRGSDGAQALFARKRRDQDLPRFLGARQVLRQRQRPAPGGAPVASARITIGAWSPFDPWAVITRTWLPPSPASRFSSPSPASNQRMKPCRLAALPAL